TGVGAIDEFCRQASEKLKAINPDLILSAALMSERGSERYYGQHPESMGQYIDILVPMIYLHSSGYSYGTCVGIANYFAQHGSPALCWAGTQTYTGSGSGLGADELKADCEAYIGSQASGVVLFRHGLGTLPNLLDLKLNE
ncbi:MAG: putative glycoside hydrolase, partial [Bacteroidales bacterium]|nr:putative glycoside hydrolase [Bacteroidales bacterium]